MLQLVIHVSACARRQQYASKYEATTITGILQKGRKGCMLNAHKLNEELVSCQQLFHSSQSLTIPMQSLRQNSICVSLK